MTMSENQFKKLKEKHTSLKSETDAWRDDSNEQSKLRPKFNNLKRDDQKLAANLEQALGKNKKLCSAQKRKMVGLINWT